MKSIFRQLILSTRRALWAIIVAYMLGIHNFYRGDKTPDDIGNPLVVSEVQEDSMPREFQTLD